MTTTIREAAAVKAPTKAGTALIQLITPGTGSSGVYPQEALEAAARDGVFPAGTQMFADHPGVTETHDRPERSIRDLAGVLTENAYWDGTALVAEAQLFDPWRGIVSQMRDAIGVSIRATARVDESDSEGRPIIAALEQGISVDFVTKAGRGGAIREVYESHRPAVTVTEALPGNLTATDLRSRLSDALGPDLYVLDHTDEWVVFEDYRDGRDTTWRQTYTADEDGRITLTGAPVQVARRVTYDALNPPSASAGVAMESHQKESPMGTIQIDEAEHKRLTATAEKVTAAEAAAKTARDDLEAARKAVTEAYRETDEQHVTRVLESAGVTFSRLEQTGLRHDLPVTEAGRLDVPAFEQRVREAAAEKQEAAGRGRPAGIGTVTESSYDEAAYLRDLGITQEA